MKRTQEENGTFVEKKSKKIDVVSWMLNHRALDTFLRPFLSELDLWCLRIVCKGFRHGIAQNLRISMDQAMGKGHLGVTKVLRDWSYSWTKEDLGIAAFGGHLEVVKWCRENGCSWDKGTCAEAAQGGQLKMLQWLRQNGCPWDQETFERAAFGGHLNLLEWLYSEAKWDLDDITWLHAVEGANVKVLSWLKNLDCPYHDESCETAAELGELEVLKWLREQGYHFGKIVCAYAARGGQLETLKWLRTEGCKWHQSTWEWAKETNPPDSPLLVWLKQQGCPGSDK